MMRNLVICAVTAIVASQAARAETLRCDAALVYEGSSADEVLNKCGAPATMRAITENIYRRTPTGGSIVVGTATTEIWRYERGSRHFPAVLKIRDGRVLSIEFEKT